MSEAGSGSRRLRPWLVTGLVAALTAGAAVSAWRAGVFHQAGPSEAGQPGAAPIATATVARRDLAATTPVSATLGYAGSWTVTGQAEAR